jgi:hypothetical protein
MTRSGHGLSTTEVAELVEFAEARAWSSFYRSAPTATADALGIRVVTFGPTTALAMAGAPFPLVNRVIGLGVGAPATEGVVDELLDVYGGIGVKDFAVQIAESAGPSELARWLDERNLVAGGAWAKAYRGNGPVSALQGPARVERASQLDVDAFGDVATRGFEMPEDFGPLFGGLVGKPDWHTYLAYDGPEAIATGAMYVMGDVAWLGMGSTVPTHRRRGAQGSLLARRLEDGIDLGCRWFVTETGAEDPDRPNASLRNMLRAGFEVAYLRRNYTPRPSV